MTYDNGFEMARHEKITKKGIKIHFAHPYYSQERGTNENTKTTLTKKKKKKKRREKQL